METDLKQLEVQLRRVADMIGTSLREKRALSRLERDLVLERLRGIYDGVSLLSTGDVRTAPPEPAHDRVMSADEVHTAAMMVTMAAMSRPDVETEVAEPVTASVETVAETTVVADAPQTLFDIVEEQLPQTEEAAVAPREDGPVVEAEPAIVVPEEVESVGMSEPETDDRVAETVVETSELQTAPEVDDNQLLFEDIEFAVEEPVVAEVDAVGEQPCAEEEMPIESGETTVALEETAATDDGVAEEIVLSIEPETIMPEPMTAAPANNEPAEQPSAAVDMPGNDTSEVADVANIEVEQPAAMPQAEPSAEVDAIAAESTTPEFHLPVEPPAALTDMPIDEAVSGEHQPQGTILDYLRRPSGNPAITRTLGETIGMAQQQPSFALPKVDDLRTVININDKFSFMSELFGGNIKSYNDFIVRLNAMTSREEALSEVERVARQYNWNTDSSVVKTFQKIFDKKF